MKTHMQKPINKTKKPMEQPKTKTYEKAYEKNI